MATVHTQGFHEEHVTHVTGHSAVEAAVGFGAVLLAILGLVNVAPVYMAAIATLAVGAALAFQGAAAHGRAGGGSVDAEFTAGLAGIVLGILAILGIETGVLIPVAVMVFSAGLLLSTGSSLQSGALAASGSHLLCGIAGIVLGIIALVGTASLTLSLVALLTLGIAVSLNGSTWSTHMVRMWRR